MIPFTWNSRIGTSIGSKNREVVARGWEDEELGDHGRGGVCKVSFGGNENVLKLDSGCVTLWMCLKRLFTLKGCIS